MDEDITAGTVDEVLARVGTDTDLAAAALELEQAKPEDGEGKRRSTLVEALQRIVAGDSGGDDTTTDDEADDDVGPEVFTADGADTSDDVVDEKANDRVGPERFTVTGE